VGLTLLATLALPGLAEPASAACANRSADPKTITTKQAEKAVVCLVNEERADHGLGKLSTKGDLNAAADKHSIYMQQHDCFAHVCPGELDVLERLVSYLGGANSWRYGENIAWGEGARGTPKRIVQAWMGSPDHRDIILTDDFEHIGVGAIWGSPYSPKASAGTFTADFGYSTG
jgi:uncharacterized protein YkwD